MPNVPPTALITLIHNVLYDLLASTPEAASSEAHIVHHVEMKILSTNVTPRYFVRIGINYHGNTIQQIQLDHNGKLIGWNINGNALKIGKDAKMLLSGYTIFKRDPGEPTMSDTKIGGGPIPKGNYIRAEFKARGWLGKTKNLDGKQLEKDIDLLKQDQTDMLVICLSETAHRKWRGEGPQYQAGRRTGINRFLQLLVSPNSLVGNQIIKRDIIFEGQAWSVSTQRVTGYPGCIMPGAEHFVTMCWRRNQ